MADKQKRDYYEVLGVNKNSTPDEIKSDTIFSDRYDWHFQDLAPALSEEAVLATLSSYPSHGGRLWMALDSVQRTLVRNPHDRTALIYLVHLMGDSYCPMHIAHEDDLGGNRVRMQWFDKSVNLHSVWDDHLIESIGLPKCRVCTHCFDGSSYCHEHDDKDERQLKFDF